LFNMNTSGSATFRDGIFAFGAGSSVDVLEGKGVKSAGAVGLLANNGASIRANGSNFSNCDIGVLANHGSSIVCGGCNASGAANTCIIALSGSNIEASAANANLAVSGFGIHATIGSHITSKGSNARKVTGVDGVNDIVVLEGSTIVCFGTAGGTNITPVTLHTNGLIFK